MRLISASMIGTLIACAAPAAQAFELLEDPAMCGQPFEMIELEDTRYLQPRFAGNHVFGCHWEGLDRPLDLSILGPGLGVTRKASCFHHTDPTRFWDGEVLIAGRKDGTFAVTFTDAPRRADRAPVIYHRCPGA